MNEGSHVMPIVVIVAGLPCCYGTAVVHSSDCCGKAAVATVSSRNADADAVSGFAAICDTGLRTASSAMHSA